MLMDDAPEPRWPQRKLALIVVLAAVLMGGVLAGCQPPGLPPPMTQPEPLDAQEFTAPVDPFHGVFVANSSPEKAVPPHDLWATPITHPAAVIRWV